MNFKQTMHAGFAAMLILGIYSCNSESHEEENNHEVSAVHEEEEQKDDHSKHEEGQMSLNNGERWEANAETTTGVNNIIQLTNDFNGSTKADYEALSASLESEFQMIFQKCTMTGEAHEHLHTFLLPMKSMFETLKGEDENMRVETLEKLKEHLTQYDKFFV